MAEQIETPAPAAEPVIPAATAPPASEPTGYMQSNGDFGDNAPDVIKSLMEKKQWTNAEQMANGYTELESFKGGSHIPEAEDVDGWKAINAARGVPESFDKYEYTTESGIDLSPELLNGFKQMAFEEQYTPSQLKRAIDFQLEAITAQGEAYDAQVADMDKADVEANKILYGINYENAMTDSKLTADKHGFAAKLAERGIAGFPVVNQMLNHIANLEAEDSIGTSAPAEPPKSLDQQMKDIKENPAFLNKFDPTHKALMVEFQALNNKIVASRQAG